MELMAQEGRTGSPAELICALLNAYESLKGEQQSRQAETIGEVAHTFNWFTREIDTLRQQVSDLEARPPKHPQTGQPDAPRVDDLSF
ncbi:MAG: hypothetical protein F6K00_35230 [Leptolyngbya sp. SIOISBB]|nr:hypothetical protein [Leptolyngbya sp. SIOISBB]NEQ48503.1 hypothetical protein [Leptolyngbya sp. SIOISBB]